MAGQGTYRVVIRSHGVHWTLRLSVPSPESVQVPDGPVARYWTTTPRAADGHV